jgi:ATP-dependent protease ClpP protease subunit
MNTWNDVLKEVQERKIKTPEGKEVLDVDGVRRDKMKAISEHTKRPLIVYAVDFLNEGKVQVIGSGVNLDWSDKEGFLEAIQDIEEDSVDVLLHSPGGLAEAADSIVDIVRGKFKHVRFIVPNIAKSAATMLALSGNEILMDIASELGPIDPQFTFRKGDGTVVTAPAQAIIDQFETAQERIANDPKILAPWLPILQQYGPSLYQQAQNAIQLSKDLVKEWLTKYMLKDDPRKGRKASNIARYLSNHNNFKSHAKRIGLQELREVEPLKPIRALDMSEDLTFQNKIWGLYYAISLTFGMTGAYKLFENTRGRALIRLVQAVQISGPTR